MIEERERDRKHGTGTNWETIGDTRMGISRSQFRNVHEALSSSRHFLDILSGDDTVIDYKRCDQDVKIQN